MTLKYVTNRSPAYIIMREVALNGSHKRPHRRISALAVPAEDAPRQHRACGTAVLQK